MRAKQKKIGKREPDVTYETAEVCARLGISRQAWHKWASRHGLSAYVVNARRSRWDANHVSLYLMSKSVDRGGIARHS